MATKRNKTDRPFTVIVEGNIGSGKTTFLNHLQKHDICVLAEPIEMWRNCNGNNLLGLLYENPSRWSFTFQMYVLLTMARNHALRTGQPIKVMERSLFSARYCFIEKLASEECIAAPSLCVMDEYFKWICSNSNADVDLIVYLRTTPEVVHSRMMERNRSEEKTVSLEYLKQLHDIHEQWLFHKTLHTCPAPVLVLDGNLDKSHIITEYTRTESHILNNITVNA